MTEAERAAVRAVLANLGVTGSALHRSTQAKRSIVRPYPYSARLTAAHKVAMMVRVFVERVTAPKEEFDLWDARLRMVTEPPPALVASFAWESDGDVTCFNVWDSPEAIADFFLERVQPFVEAGGQPANKPQRLGRAIRAYVRPG
jgi:hypothetical protein